MIIKRIEPLQCGKVAGTLYALMGLLIGLLFTFISLAGGIPSDGLSVFGPLFGVGAVIVLPICYGVIGFLVSMLMAAFYNLVAKLVGGFEIQVE